MRMRLVWGSVRRRTLRFSHAGLHLLLFQVPFSETARLNIFSKLLALILTLRLPHRHSARSLRRRDVGMKQLHVSGSCILFPP